MRAKRSLGQNFLVDPNQQRRIVAALEVDADDTVIEIGPGRGALTRHMVQGERRPRRLVAIELDHDLADRLRADYRDSQGVEVVHADFMAWDPAAVLADTGPVKVVGNIPYNITTPILFRLLDWRPAPERVVVMVQKEVAERILAPPGTRAYGALTVGIRAQADVESLFGVGRGAFRPVPDVDSAVIRIRPRPADATAAPLRDLTRAAFGLRRKQIQKILRTAPGYGLDPGEAEAVLADTGLRPQDRPETLDPPTFVRLAAALERRGFPRRAAG